MFRATTPAQVFNDIQDKITRLIDISKGLADEQGHINKQIELQQKQIDILAAQLDVMQQLAAAIDPIAKEVDRLSSLVKS